MRDFQPPNAFTSPRFGQIATFMRLPHSRDLDTFEENASRPASSSRAPFGPTGSRLRA
jgi:hypothetical protein